MKLMLFAVTLVAMIGCCTVNAAFDVLRFQHLPNTSHWTFVKDEVVCDSDGKVKTVEDVFSEAVKSSKELHHFRAYELYVSVLKERSLKYAAMLTAYGYNVTTMSEQENTIVCPLVLWMLKNTFKTIKDTFRHWTKGEEIEQLVSINISRSLSSVRCVKILLDFNSNYERIVLSRYPPPRKHENLSLMQRVEKECQLKAESKDMQQDLTDARPFDDQDLSEIYRSLVLIPKNDPNQAEKPSMLFNFLLFLEKVNEEYNISKDTATVAVRD